MSGWMIVVDRLSDLPAAVSGYPSMTARDYIMQPRATGARRPRSSTCRAATATRPWATTARCWPRRAATRWCPRSRPCSSWPGALLRLRPGRARGHAQPHHPPPGRPAHRLVPAPGLPGPRRRPALRPLRPAAVRLVPLPDPRGVRQGRRASGACASWRPSRSPSWARPARRSSRPRSRRIPPALEVAARPRPRPGSRWPCCSTRRSSCRPPTCRRSATSSASPSPWGWAWR